MKVSVVIPTFNSSSYIRKAIKSVVNACDGLDYEILIVDDVSDDIDKLKRQCSDFNRIKIISKKIKTNAADSRNIGFFASDGDVVFFLDSDDSYCPDAIVNRIRLHEETASGVVFGNFYTVDNGLKRACRSPEYRGGDAAEYIAVKGGDCRSSTVSILKEYHCGALFDDHSKKHQDWIFLIRAYDAGERIFYDSSEIVELDISGDNRMSRKLNPDASKYLMDRYLKNDTQRAFFVVKCLKAAIRLGDRASAEFFYQYYRKKRLGYNKSVLVWYFLHKSRSDVLVRWAYYALYQTRRRLEK